MRLKYLILIICLLFTAYNIKAQNIGAGASLLYNIQSESLGFGARLSFYPNRTLSIVPQLSYYPGFNKVNEFNVGLGLEVKFLPIGAYYFYLIGHGGYNSWNNYHESPMLDAKKANWNLEGGLGISNRKCLRPFLEYRYNVRFMETHLQLGFLYIFNCKSSGSGSRGGGARKGGAKSSNRRSCSAYN